MELRVLVVDDEESIRKLMVKIIEIVRPNAQITTAREAKEALDIMTECEAFDLVFTDVTMPGMFDGLDVLIMAKEIKPSTKVYVMSGIPANKEKAEKHGADVFFNKPANIKEIIDTIIKDFLEKDIEVKIQTF